MKYILLFATIVVASISFAQNNVGIGTNLPNPNAILDLDPPAKDKGFLTPRLNQAQRVALGAALGNNDKGLLVFDPIDTLFYFWDGTKWIPFPVDTDQQTLTFDANTNTLSISNGNSVNIPVSTGPTGATGAQGQQGTPGANGVTGATGPTGQSAPGSYNSTFAFNPSGTAAITDGGGTLTTTGSAWLAGGNTTPSSNNIGQTGNQPLVFITNNQNRMSVEANGDVFVAGSKPIIIRRFSCNGCDNPDRDTGVNTTDWVAYVGGIYPTNNTSTDTRSVRFAMYPKNNTWWFKGDLESPGNETWSVDVVFVKRQLVDDQRPANPQGGGTGF
jgi:hypothetical protein